MGLNQLLASFVLYLIELAIHDGWNVLGLNQLLASFVLYRRFITPVLSWCSEPCCAHRPVFLMKSAPLSSGTSVPPFYPFENHCITDMRTRFYQVFMQLIDFICVHYSVTKFAGDARTKSGNFFLHNEISRKLAVFGTSYSAGDFQDTCDPCFGFLDVFVCLARFFIITYQLPLLDPARPQPAVRFAEMPYFPSKLSIALISLFIQSLHSDKDMEFFGRAGA